MKYSKTDNRMMFSLIVLLILIVNSYSLREIPYLTLNSKSPEDVDEFEYKVVIPPVQTDQANFTLVQLSNNYGIKINRYVCYSKSLDELGESYVTKLLTEPNMEVAPHHVDSGLCLDPQHKDATWECERGTACRGDSIEFSVTDNFNKKQNPLYQLPKDYSSPINNGRKPHYLIVQVHLYEIVKEPISPANITITFRKEPTTYNYQKFMLANSGVIPANQNSGFFTHVGCEWKRPRVLAFDYYVHTHTHGLFAEGFLIRNNSLTYLGGQMTQGRPKVEFKIVNGPIEILPGDILASRCLFVNKENKSVDLGPEDTCIFQLSVGYEPQYHEYFRRPPACMSSSPDFTFCSSPATAILC